MVWLLQERKEFTPTSRKDVDLLLGETRANFLSMFLSFVFLFSVLCSCSVLFLHLFHNFCSSLTDNMWCDLILLVCFCFSHRCFVFVFVFVR